MSTDETLAQAGMCVRAGQSSERLGNAEGLAAAIKHYETALAIIRTLPTDDPRARHALAIASMNHGNALQRQHTADSLEAAVLAYDEAIRQMGTLPLENNEPERNTLGAAWMNRGHALLARAEPASLAGSIKSFGEAITVLQTLPLDGPIAYRMNLAAALMNEANAFVKTHDPVQALDSAAAAMALTAPEERVDAMIADIGLKSRRVSCEALGQRLYLASQHGESTKELGDRAIDLVDSGLALTRYWETRGEKQFRYIALRLFSFGVQLYARQLPQFLAEFVLEHLDPEHSPGAMAETEDFYLIASQALDTVRNELETRRATFLDTPGTARLLQNLRDIREATDRLHELRSRHVKVRNGSAA